MSIPGKILIGVGVTIAILLIAVAFFLRHLVTRSFPETDGTLTAAGLHAPVEIARDERGIPHITAQNEHDLIFAAGYVHAQDRLWQMDVTRRAGEGRLSEVFDTATVRFDKLFRTLGFAQLAESLYLNLRPESRQMLEDYAAGVNACIKAQQGRYPIEFDMLRYDPEPWTPQHSLLTARMMAWEMSFAWWVDLTYADIAARVDERKFREALPGFPDSLSRMSARDIAGLPFGLPDGARGMMAAVREYREMFGIGPFSAGSNAWAVSGERTASGKPLLANDPHLKTSVPGKWYEMHLAAPGWNVAGMSIPGAPVVVIGHNDSLAWGLTNAMLDDADFYIERVDSANPAAYRFRNASLPFTSREEVIRIGASDSVAIVVRSTVHGPVIDDVHPYTQRAAGEQTTNRTVMSLRWTGFEISDEISAMVRMNTATNARAFEDALREFSVPGQSLVYADAAGNIAFWMAARVPVRSGGGNPMLPRPGWNGDNEWQGFVPFGELPRLFNPPGGAIICANQKPVAAAYPYYLSTLWETPSRHQRIRELLAGAGKFTTNDFQRFQMDIMSPYNRELTRHILAAYPDSVPADKTVQGALEYLRNWDFRDAPTEVTSAIFNMFFVKLLRNTYLDEMGEATFNDFIFFSAIPYRVTAQLMAQDSSGWFDNVTTPAPETKEEMIQQSMIDAVEELTRLMGSEMKQWQWGSVHEAVFRHPFGARKPLDRVFNVGFYPLGGSATTVNKADYKLSNPFELFSGPSMRQIVDLALPSEAMTVIQLGQSGQALHPHYQDQTAMWLNGGYHRVTIDAGELKGMKLERLVLEPGRP